MQPSIKVAANEGDKEMLLALSEDESSSSSSSSSSPTTDKSAPSKEASQRLRKVRFHEDENESGSSSSFPVKEDNSSPPLFVNLTEEVIRELWYHKEEINESKRQVGNILRRNLYQPCGSSSTTTENEDNGDDDKAGLERHSLQRHNAKKTAIKFVLLAQTFKVAKNPDYLRRVSEKCTAEAKALAITQGYRDFCQVFAPILAAANGTGACLFQRGTKRDFSSRFRGDEQERSKVQRALSHSGLAHIHTSSTE